MRADRRGPFGQWRRDGDLTIQQRERGPAPRRTRPIPPAVPASVAGLVRAGLAGGVDLVEPGGQAVGVGPAGPPLREAVGEHARPAARRR